jgi:hypothetical protein
MMLSTTKASDIGQQAPQCVGDMRPYYVFPGCRNIYDAGSISCTNGQCSVKIELTNYEGMETSSMFSNPFASSSASLSAVVSSMIVAIVAFAALLI